MDAMDRALRARLHRAGDEMSARALREGGMETRGRRTLRPLLAAVALAVLVAGVGGGFGLHSRLNARQVAPAVTLPAVPSPAVPTPHPSPTWEAAPYSMPGAKMAWDSTRQQLVAFESGSASKGVPSVHTWIWDGSWREAQPPMSPGQYGGGEVLVDIPALHGVALLGPDAQITAGESVGGSWLWDGATWRALPKAGFDACFGPTAAAWDERRHQLLAVVSNLCTGGMVYRPPQTWTWDGRTWRHAAGIPTQVEQKSLLTWDPDSNTVLFLGGNAQAWSWTGTTWKPNGGIPPLTKVNDPDGAAWDARAGAVLVYQGPAYDGSGGPYLLAFRRGTRSELPATNYPERVTAIVADTTHRRLLVVGQEPIATTEKPMDRHSMNDYYVLVWNGQGWSHVTWSELAAQP